MPCQRREDLQNSKALRADTVNKHINKDWGRWAQWGVRRTEWQFCWIGNCDKKNINQPPVSPHQKQAVWNQAA